MRRAVCWTILVILAGLALGACSLERADEPAPMTAFDALARRLPADLENAFFFDFKPDDQTRQHWATIRDRLQQNPVTRQPLEDLLARFRVEAYQLDSIIEGPAAAAQWGDTTVVLLPVLDEAAAWESMVRNLGDEQSWDQETVQGKLIYHGMFWEKGRATFLAWTMDEDLLYLAYRPIGRSVGRLSDLLGLARGATLDSVDSWELLRQRLPNAPLAIAFFPVAELVSRPTPVAVEGYPPAPGDQPPSAVLERHLEALALAFTPEGTGLRMDIQGVLGPDAGTEPVLQALFTLPAVETAGWDHLPANTALALLSHDAPVIWPWFSGVLGLDLDHDPFSAVLALDLEADLLSAEGPLQNGFALAVRPPWPDQPVIQGLPALHALLVSKDVAQAQVEKLAVAMEGRGAVLGTTDLVGMELRTQVGTQLSGYTLSFGLDGDTLFMASSPEVIRQAIDDRREGSSLVSTGPFQAIVSRLPGDPFLLAYVDSQRLIELAQANTDGGQDGANEMVQFLDLFDAMGVGLRLQSEQGDAGPGWVEGVCYFLIEE